QCKAELLPHVRRGMLQCAQGRLVFLLVARHRDVNAGVTEVVSHANFRHRDQGQARVFQFVTHDLRNLFTQSFSNTLWTMHKSEIRGQQSEVRTNSTATWRDPLTSDL